jgi:hypothetical protein
MNRPKLRITSEELFGDPNRRRFSTIKDDFNPTEIGFLVENLNRRGDLNLDPDSLNLASINALIEILSKIEDDFTETGRILSLLIRVKLKNP